ncbi:hypothetical protein GWN42_04130, partial [candidate division KSB1 bacterium]|nr:hypothetical protein [Phycisphaerae bacterium]NIU23087.1 hypothetical protein [candidate division KSB1 bacterium]NIU89868.1 hypothetical protein [candidate division KSB1 bacterium]NIV91995.1 hypothetical protein [candidate division KSB1 bacterium]NIW16938.1 hypothetical protein [candidate division KSB1 bacterium]
NAIDEATLTIELNAPASHFLSMTPMAIMSATPSWTIEEHGETWTEHLKIVTNGRYVLNAWIHNVYTELIRNPIMPMDMGGSGNIVLHMTHVVPDNDTGYDSWLDNHFDLATIPFEELESHLAEFPDQTFQIPSISVYYISFRMTKPPFDNVHVRRALSAAFDRTKFVSELLQDRNLPSNLQSPPGVFSTSSIDE